jgi:hypothetical protein
LGANAGCAGHVRWLSRRAEDDRNSAMAKTIKLSLTEDEAEMIADALEVDMENYVEAAKEARGNNQRDDVKTFTEAAERIQGLLNKVRDLLE